jgi:hypothetical protein
MSDPVPAPLTVRLPPLREEAEATPRLYVEADESDGSLRRALANIAPALRQPFLSVCEMCEVIYDPSERMDDLPFCSYECASGGGSHAPEHCDHCGIHVREPGLCDRCLREFRAVERWANEICGDCRLKNSACHCAEDDYDYYGDGNESPPPSGRPCPVCGCNFEGNDWHGVCSRACASPRGWE